MMSAELSDSIGEHDKDQSYILEDTTSVVHNIEPECALKDGADVDLNQSATIHLDELSKKDRQKLLENTLTDILPDQLSEMTSESDGDNSNLLDEPSLRSTEDASFSRPSSCIFVASLAATLSDSELNASVTKEFTKYGKIISVKVLRDPVNRPYAFVQYASDEDALNALAQAQGTTLNNRNIRCERAKVNRTVFISSTFSNPMEGKLTIEKVVDLMGKFGELEQVVPSRDHMYKKNYYPSEIASSWFIQYAYRDDAIRAYLQMKLNYEYIVEWAQNVDVPPRFNFLLSKEKIDELERLERDRAKKQPIFIDNKSVFIGQLNINVTKPLLLERFSKYGEIENCNLIHKQDQGKCFAFIKFKNPASAAKALERENHSVFMDKILHVQIREVSNARRGSTDSHKSFQGPQLNLAPPPLNVGRRASTGSFGKFMYPMHGAASGANVGPCHMHSNIPSPYLYGPIHEARRNTINASPQLYNNRHKHNHSIGAGSEIYGVYGDRGAQNYHFKASEGRNYSASSSYDTDEDYDTAGMAQRLERLHLNKQNKDKDHVTIEEEQDFREREDHDDDDDDEDDFDRYEEHEADDTQYLELESNSSFTTFSAGTGTFRKGTLQANSVPYHKNHGGFKKRRNMENLRLSRMDQNFYYGPPFYYSMEYCPPPGGPVGTPPAHMMQAPPGAHIPGAQPPSQHSPIFYYFPMPPPTPTFTNPFPHEHSHPNSGYNGAEDTAGRHDKVDLDY